MRVRTCANTQTHTQNNAKKLFCNDLPSYVTDFKSITGCVLCTSSKHVFVHVHVSLATFLLYCCIVDSFSLSLIHCRVIEHYFRYTFQSH